MDATSFLGGDLGRVTTLPVHTQTCAGEPRFRWTVSDVAAVRGEPCSFLLYDVLRRERGQFTRGGDWDLYCGHRAREAEVLEVYGKLDGRRRVNRIFGEILLGHKHRLARLLHRASALAQKRGASDALFGIAPQTFVFPEDFDRWCAATAAHPEKIWISKIGNIGRGQGVKMVTDVNVVTPDPDLVLQEYVRTPDLLDGFKYTLRVFVAVTSLEPLRAWIYPDGLTKTTTRPFAIDRASLENRFAHLTNSDVLRNDVGVDLNAHRTTLAAYRQRLRREGRDDARLFHEIRALSAKMILAAREPLLEHNARRGFTTDGQFQVFGLDVLVDRDLRPWLLEVNHTPALDVKASNQSESGRNERAVKEGAVSGLLRIAGVLPDGPHGYEPIFPSAGMFDWLPCYERVRESDRADFDAMARFA